MVILSQVLCHRKQKLLSKVKMSVLGQSYSLITALKNTLIAVDSTLPKTYHTLQKHHCLLLQSNPMWN